MYFSDLKGHSYEGMWWLSWLMPEVHDTATEQQFRVRFSVSSLVKKIFLKTFILKSSLWDYSGTWWGVQVFLLTVLLHFSSHCSIIFSFVQFLWIRIPITLPQCVIVQYIVHYCIKLSLLFDYHLFFFWINVTSGDTEHNLEYFHFDAVSAHFYSPL
jgi:hypothetical protein